MARLRPKPRELVRGVWPFAPALPDHDEVEPLRRFVQTLRDRTGGMAVRQIAIAADISQPSMTAILDGEAWPDFWTVGKLQRAFGDLIGGATESGEPGNSTGEDPFLVYDEIHDLARTNRPAIVEALGTALGSPVQYDYTPRPRAAMSSRAQDLYLRADIYDPVRNLIIRFVHLRAAPGMDIDVAHSELFSETSILRAIGRDMDTSPNHALLCPTKPPSFWLDTASADGVNVIWPLDRNDLAGGFIDSYRKIFVSAAGRPRVNRPG